MITLLRPSLVVALAALAACGSSTGTARSPSAALRAPP